MERRFLRKVKARSKRLETYTFKKAKQDALPPPLHKVSGARR